MLGAACCLTANNQQADSVPVARAVQCVQRLGVVHGLCGDQDDRTQPCLPHCGDSGAQFCLALMPDHCGCWGLQERSVREPAGRGSAHVPQSQPTSPCWHHEPSSILVPNCTCSACLIIICCGLQEPCVGKPDSQGSAHDTQG